MLEFCWFNIKQKLLLDLYRNINNMHLVSSTSFTRYFHEDISWSYMYDHSVGSQQWHLTAKLQTIKMGACLVSFLWGKALFMNPSQREFRRKGIHPPPHHWGENKILVLSNLGIRLVFTLLFNSSLVKNWELIF